MENSSEPIHFTPFKKISSILGGGSSPEKPSQEETLRRLRQVRNAVEQFASDNPDTTRSGKAFLPDRALIPLGDETGQFLISNRTLRAGKLFAEREVEDTFRGDVLQRDRYFFQNADVVQVPSDFFKKGSYIALLIPAFEQRATQHSNGQLVLTNKGYDVTVLHCDSDTTANKLASYSEHGYCEGRWKIISVNPNEMVGDPIPCPDVSQVQVKDSKQPVEIWKGDRARFSISIGQGEGKSLQPENIERYRHMVIRGTVCYQLVVGNPEVEKKRVEQGLQRPVRQEAPTTS